MKNNFSSRCSSRTLCLVIGALLLLGSFGAPSVLAQPDRVFFNVEGDTTLTTMNQGDEFAWGSNCVSGATINWEIWFDGNSNSVIDPSVDAMLTSENMTDGNPLSDGLPDEDGWVMSEPFSLSGEPGAYIFKATDVATAVTIQKVITMVAMPSPPNQFTGQITIPGFTPPNSFLANRIIFAESETGEGGVSLAATDNTGSYAMNIGAAGTGVDFYLMANAVPGFLPPEGIIATASGVVGGNDFLYSAATDSIWGFVIDDLGAIIAYETNVSAQSDYSERETTTQGGRYVLYFTDADVGNWYLGASGRNSPTYVTPDQFGFNRDGLGSLRHDIILTRADTAVFVRITENGGLPTSNYLVNAYSSVLQGQAEAVTGTGADNIVELRISSLDPSGWTVSIDEYDWDLPIPFGLIVESGAGGYTDVSPGDTVTFNLVNGHLVTGTITQDPEDGPIVWDDFYAFAGSWGTRINGDGTYSLYTDTGSYWVNVWSDGEGGYVTDPNWISFVVTGPPVTGLDFTINRAHCQVSGTLTGVPLPLDGSFYAVTARTGTDGSNGYEVYGYVDQFTGDYTLDLCDGEWTITPPCCLNTIPLVTPPDSVVLTIGEPPDNSRTLDFAYSSIGGCCDGTMGSIVLDDGINDCGDLSDQTVDIVDLTSMIDHLFINHWPLCCADEADIAPLIFGEAQDGFVDVADLTALIDHLFINMPLQPPCP